MGSTWMDMEVARLVTERPGRAVVLERYGIDFCCRGGQSLKEACAQRGLDPAEVANEIELADAHVFASLEENWSDASMGELIDHIIEHHHEYLWESLPRISELLSRVVRRHGDAHPELVKIREVFEPLRLDMEEHMNSEELELFPRLRELDEVPELPRESVRDPVSDQLKGHQTVIDDLARIRDLAHSYEPPRDACDDYRALLRELRDLEMDVHMHVHKENNLLFPRLG